MEKPAKNGISYEFGEFRLDAIQRVVFRAGRPVALAPKVIETLLALVERRGTLVTKDELMARLWPETFVEESNLTQNVFQLRKVLGDDGKHFIETVPRRGYRFMGEVKTLVEPDNSEWILSSRQRTRIVHEEETTSDDHENQTVSPAPYDLAITPERRVRPKTSRNAIIVAPIVVLGLLAGGFGLSRLIRQRRGQQTQSFMTAPAIEFESTAPALGSAAVAGLAIALWSAWGSQRTPASTDRRRWNLPLEELHSL
jgi:DNA-binding winged helix-turn-helix (wHTH) protein